MVHIFKYFYQSARIQSISPLSGLLAYINCPWWRSLTPIFLAIVMELWRFLCLSNISWTSRVLFPNLWAISFLGSFLLKNKSSIVLTNGSFKNSVPSNCILLIFSEMTKSFEHFCLVVFPQPYFFCRHTHKYVFFQNT